MEGNCKVKIEKFDVVELKNGNKATIIDKINEEKFFQKLLIITEQQ